MPQNRPLAITVICIIGFLGFGLSLFTMPALYGTLTATYGAWYGPFWVASLALTLVSLIGYWLMKKWGVFLYIGTFIAGTAVGVLQGIPFTPLGLVVPLLISALGLVYLRRMR